MEEYVIVCSEGFFTGDKFSQEYPEALKFNNYNKAEKQFTDLEYSLSMGRDMLKDPIMLIRDYGLDSEEVVLTSEIYD